MSPKYTTKSHKDSDAASIASTNTLSSTISLLKSKNKSSPSGEKKMSLADKANGEDKSGTSAPNPDEKKKALREFVFD